MSISATISINNAVGETTDVLNLVAADVRAALATWSDLLAGSVDLTIDVELVSATPAGRADGNAGNFALLGQVDGVALVEGAPAHELRSGANTPSALPDVTIRIQDSYLKGELWLDPTPSDATDIPSQRTDFVSAALHEIGHALGFIGYWGSSLADHYKTTFDQKSVSSGGYWYFTGANAQAVYGGAVPLTLGGPYHFGNRSPGPGSDLMADLMNGVVFDRGVRYSPSALDLAALADLGLGTIRSEILGSPLNGAHFDAGPGLDTLLFDGASTDYAVAASGPGFSIRGPMAYSADVINAERLRFSDHIVALDVAGDAGEGYRIYQAAFARTPETGGLSFWVAALDRGDTLHDVASGFVDSAEFKAAYGATPSSAHIVDLFYQNVLGRAGDQAGVSYWTGLLNHGAAVADVLVGFSESAENIARVAPALAHGVVLDLAPFV